MIDNSWYGIITNTVAIVESMIRYKKTFEMKLYSGVHYILGACSYIFRTIFMIVCYFTH